jgi:methylenetetrahydrofolate dehydrogenase (NADP+) / methenyltetrahydrofolate cyclohydrolase
VILDGKKVSEEILDDIKNKIVERELKLSLAVIYLGNNEASEIYIRNKEKACNKCHIGFKLYHMEKPLESDVIKLINELNEDNNVNGIILQSPIPDYLDYNKLSNLISEKKDIDGFNKNNVYHNYLKEKCILPCTVKGIIRLLDYYHVNLDGANVVIVGRGEIVGKPLIMSLLNRNATVTICHTHTKNLKNICNLADILISATGVSHLIKNDYVKDGATVIDVGISRVNGKLSGDVDFDNVKDKCKYITPVPGGVGPMTVAMIIENIYETM